MPHILSRTASVTPSRELCETQNMSQVWEITGLISERQICQIWRRHWADLSSSSWTRSPTSRRATKMVGWSFALFRNRQRQHGVRPSRRSRYNSCRLFCRLSCKHGRACEDFECRTCSLFSTTLRRVIKVAFQGEDSCHLICRFASGRTCGGCC
jgi:hypothetical protein